MELILNGKQADLSDFEADELAQAVLISLFSWRRSRDDDGISAPFRQGWWGDTFTDGDQIGSRLWLLRREKLTADVVARAVELAQEALQWLIDDGIAQDVDVNAEIAGVDRLNLSVEVIKPGDAQRLQARFLDVWSEV